MRKHGATFKRRDPAAWINKRMPLPEDQQRDIGIAYRASLQAMLRGHGTEQTWSTLAVSLNIALMLCQQGFHAGKIAVIRRAQEAMITCRNRADVHNRYGFTGDEARAVMTACNIHDEQTAMASKDQISTAIREVHRMVQNGEVFA